MSDNPGTVPLAEPASSGHRVVKLTPPDPVFGHAGPDGSLGKLGQYRVVRQLGCGGMGAVYLAEDEGLQRRVALKVMLPSAAADPLAKERFLREARASAAVKHDNVVTIYQVGEDRSIPFIAMEFLSGAPLDQFLARKGRLTVQQVLRLGQEAAEGLAAAHVLGLIHRDIKPANIWLEAPKGRVKILDFGIARRVAEQPGNGLTGANTVVGTPGYMSPEQARGKQLDHRSDVFSLGIVLYQLTTGQKPFDGDSVLAILTALAVDDPPPVRSINPEIPPQLESLVHRMLAKKPDHRPASAQAVAEELGAIAKAGETQLAANATVPQVVYVPIAMTAMEQFTPTEFADLGDTHTEVITDRHTIPQARAKSGPGLWIAAGVGVLLSVLLVIGVVMSLKKPTPETSPDPSPTPQPRKERETKPPPPPKPFDPTPTGYGIRFAPEQAIVIPGLSIPDESPFTLEGCITVDDWFKASSPVFGTKHRMWVAIADTPQGLVWEGYGSIGSSDVKVTGGPVVKGKRTHVALVRSRDELRLFVDGKLAETAPARGLLTGSGLISMGGEKFSGLIDEFRVSRTARYDRDFSPVMNPDRDTLALYHFDEGQGDTLTDKSGGSHDCKIGPTKWANPVVRPIGKVTQAEWQQMLMKHLAGHLVGQSATDQELDFLQQVGVDFFEAGLFDDKAMEKLSKMRWASRTRSIEIHAPPRKELPAITDEGLKHIPSFTNLLRLLLPGSRVTDAGLKPVTSLPNLHTIILSGTGITDNAAPILAEVKKLVYLDLSNTTFGDDGVKGLAPLTELTELHLEGTPLTDKGLEHLQGHKKLKVLNVKRTRVTAEGVKQLQDTLPDIKVTTDAKP